MRKPVHPHRFIEVSWYESAYSAKSLPPATKPRYVTTRGRPFKSTRERYIEHASNPACSSCHDLIDPIGFGFEHYDASGDGAQDGVQSTQAVLFFTVSSDTEFQVCKSSPHISPPVRMSRHASSSSGASTSMDFIMMPHSNPQSMPEGTFAQSEKTLQATLSRFVQIPHVTARAWEKTWSDHLWRR